MAKTPPQKPAATPDDFPQVEPQELFPTNNIRFVMWETAKLTERVDGLAKSIEKFGPSFEKALDRNATDLKDRLAELRADSKETATKVGNVKESIDSFKGAMKVFAGIYALALVLVAAFLAWYLRPEPAPPPSPAQNVAAPRSTTSG